LLLLLDIIVWTVFLGFSLFSNCPHRQPLFIIAGCQALPIRLLTIVFPEKRSSSFIQVELDIRLLEHLQQLCLLRTLESGLIMLVHIQLLLVPAFIRCERRIGLIFVIVIDLDCWSRALDNLILLLANDCVWVLIIKLIRCSNESSLLRDELVEILFLRGFVGILPSERRHPHIECVHGP